MNDTTKDLQYANTVIPGTSMRTKDFADAELLGAKRKAQPGVGSLLLGLSLVLIGVLCFFAMLRILFQPDILGDAGMVLFVVPLAIIAAIAFLFFGVRTLILRTRHPRH